MHFLFYLKSQAAKKMVCVADHNKRGTSHQSLYFTPQSHTILTRRRQNHHENIQNLNLAKEEKLDHLFHEDGRNQRQETQTSRPVSQRPHATHL